MDNNIKMKDIIWCEWRNTKDKEFAKHLFDLVCHSPITEGAKLCLIATCAIFGTLVGVGIGLCIAYLRLKLLDWGALWLEAIVFIFVFLIIGGYIGVIMGKRISWGRWLRSISPKNFPQDEDQTKAQQVFSFLNRVTTITPDTNVIISLTLVGMILIAFGMYLVMKILANEMYGAHYVESNIIILFLAMPILGMIVGFFRNFWESLIYGGFLITMAFVEIFMKIEGFPFYLIIHFLIYIFACLLGTFLSYLTSKSPFIHEHRSLWIWWDERPLPSQLMFALRVLGQQDQWQSCLKAIEVESEKLPEIEAIIADLVHPNWIERFVARSRLIVIGGKAIEPLSQLVQDSENNMDATALDLIEAIGRETTHRFASTSKFTCPQCFVKCIQHQEDVRPDFTVEFYGCRQCKQSQNLELMDITAVLDRTMEEHQSKIGSKVRVNWLARKSLFDFDRVEIIAADDWEIEHFCIQVGNDTDEIRQPKYKGMECVVKCNLSPNSMKILENTFGRVKIIYGC